MYPSRCGAIYFSQPSASRLPQWPLPSRHHKPSLCTFDLSATTAKMNNIESALIYLATNPWINLVASRWIFAIGAGFTSPASIQRLVMFALTTIYASLSISNYSKYIQSTGLVSLIIISSISSVPLIYFDRLIYRKWAYEDRRAIFGTAPQKSVKKDALDSDTIADGEDTYSSRFSFGQEVSGTVRGPGTSWEVKGLPHFSSTDPQWIPSPTVFIAWKLAIIIPCFFLNEYVMDARLAVDHDLMLPSRVPFLTRVGEITQDEVVARLIVGVWTWTHGYCFMQMFFGFPALIAVCFKPSEVALWRPAFGSIQDAYTVRGFWGSVCLTMFEKNTTSVYNTNRYATLGNFGIRI